MANPTLHWRMLAPVTVANGSAAAFLEALYTMGTATTYADGTARVSGTFTTPGTASLPATLGTGSAWTFNYDTTTLPDGKGSKTAIYGYAPTTTAINQAVVICGSSTVAGGVWKQLYGDSRTANFLYLGIAKNSGTYTSWNNATTPFTSGDFSGLGYVSANTSLYAYVYMWECEEAVMIQFANSANVSGGIAGAFIDPLSANTANAETDGRLYGMSTNGGSNYMSATWLSQTAPTSAPLLVNNAVAGEMHTVTFTPGAGTIVSTARFGSFGPGPAFISRNGDLPEIPVQMWNTTQYLGQLRQMFITRDSASGSAWNVGLSPKGYLMGASVTSATDALLLTY